MEALRSSRFEIATPWAQLLLKSLGLAAAGDFKGAEEIRTICKRLYWSSSQEPQFPLLVEVLELFLQVESGANENKNALGTYWNSLLSHADPHSAILGMLIYLDVRSARQLTRPITSLVLEWMAKDQAVSQVASGLLAVGSYQGIYISHRDIYLDLSRSSLKKGTPQFSKAIAKLAGGPISREDFFKFNWNVNFYFKDEHDCHIRTFCSRLNKRLGRKVILNDVDKKLILDSDILILSS